ncbi:hypothetical protein BKA82DRAFT_128275, partial [Pisolithus tinctorius]
GAFNACILVKCDDHWIMLPNADYVPQPFIFEGEIITPLHNGWFGHIDCFQWPQLFAECYTWSLCVPQKVAYGDNPMWKCYDCAFTYPKSSLTPHPSLPVIHSLCTNSACPLSFTNLLCSNCCWTCTGLPLDHVGCSLRHHVTFSLTSMW